MKFKFFLFIFLLMVLGACQSDEAQQQTPKVSTVARQSADLLTYVNHQQILSQLADLQSFKLEIKATLKQPLPVMPLAGKDITRQNLVFAQAIALDNKEFTSQCFLPTTKEPLLNMVTDIREPKPREIRKAQVSGDVVLVEMYNFYYNTVVHAFVDKSAQKVVKVVSAPGKQPNLTNKLKMLAQKIALSYPSVRKQLGLADGNIPNDFEVVVRNSKCERSRHLGAAVTVTKKGAKETFWALVDLTELTTIGYQWMPLWDPNRPQLVTERSLQNEVVAENYCKDTTELNMNNWHIKYQLTNSDGIEIIDATYNGKLVLKSAKIVDWHVSYPDKKDFGYSDAMGCPQFSSAAVVAFEPPEIQPIMNDGKEVGFSFVQDYRSPVWPKACNYRYQNLFEFYEDGRFRIAGVNLGLGCSNNGWYRPVFRINLAEADKQKVAAWENGHWTEWTKENWNVQDKKVRYSPEGYLFKMTNSDGSGYYLEPSNGQFGDAARGDHAYTFVTVEHLGQGEGELDMSTFGSCCNTNFEQGPDQFMKPAESLNGKNVIWYVPQMKNSDAKGKQYCWVETRVVNGHEGFETYNGVVGPMFVPFASAK